MLNKEVCKAAMLAVGFVFLMIAVYLTIISIIR